MKEKFIENGIEYLKHGDYYFPNLAVPNNKEYNIGKYGRLHAKFIKENRPCFYTARMIDGTWLDYLEKINNSAKEMLDRFIRELVAKQGITEVLKASEQIAWISAMEQIRHTAEEFVLKEVVYARGYFKK